PAGPAPPAGGGRYPERRRGRPWPPGGSTGFPPGDSPRLPHRPAAAGGSRDPRPVSPAPRPAVPGAAPASPP
ncbi:Transcriptional regulator, y4mF family, partial [Dysosmobacter welbionis]